MGDRRGWFLLALQPLAIAATAVVGLLLLDSTSWIVVLPVLAVLIVAWLGQAVHAHQRAVELGAEPGGELQIAWALPVILAVMTGFWLFGGDRGSPAAALEEYVSAWHSGRVDDARGLFVEPVEQSALAEAWRAQEAYVGARVAQEAARYGPSSGLDPQDPFGGLRFVEQADRRTPESTVVAVEIVRRQRVERTLFGLIPTATQETVLVERAGLIRLRAVPAEWPAWLPAGQPRPLVWRIEEVLLPLPQGRDGPSAVAGTHHLF